MVTCRLTAAEITHPQSLGFKTTVLPPRTDAKNLRICVSAYRRISQIEANYH